MECTDTEKHLKHTQSQAETSKKQDVKQKKLELQDDVQAQAAFTLLGSQTSQLYLLNEDQIKKQAIQNKVDSTGSKDEIIARLASKNDNQQNNNKGKNLLMLQSSSSNGPSHNNNNNNNNNTTSSTVSTNNNNALVTTNTQETLIEFKKRKRIHIDSLPSNLHSLGVSQLRSVCAANGLLPYLRENMTKTEILDVLDECIYDDD